MRARVVVCGVAIQLLAGLNAHALDTKRRVTQYAQTHFGARDGMPHGLVNSMAQTPDGYLWTSSEEGLARFDGATFTIFDHRRTEGIPTNEFTSVVVDRAGGLWAGTREHGVLRLIDGEFRAAIWEAGAEATRVRMLGLDPSGDVWVGTADRGLVRLRFGALVTRLTTGDGLPSNDVRSILTARDGSLWIGTFRGLVRLQDNKIVRGPAALDDHAIYALAQGAGGELWCATGNGLAHVRGDQVEMYGPDRLPIADIRRVLFDRDGNLWIGAGNGVARMTPDGQIAQLPQPIAMVLALFEDAEGNVWVGSEKGLDRVRDGDVLPYGALEGITDEPVFGIREDAIGTMWISSSGGLFRLPAGATTATKIADEHGTMYAIFPDSHGDIWFGARDGAVGRWRDGKFTWLGKQPWERVRSMGENKDGIWLGTEHGLFLMHGDRLEDAEAILPGGAISAITTDETGAMWVGTEGRGLMKWNGGAFVAIPAGGPPPSSHITTVHFDPDGTLWAGTEGDGLWRLRDGTWYGFTSKDGMFDDLVWRFLDDGRGHVWLSSNRGIWRVSRRQLDERAAGLRSSIDSMLYGEADGMRDRECNGAIEPSGWRTSDGRLWFPNHKGLVVIDPTRLHPSQPPRAVVESIRVDGHPHRLAGAIELAPGSTRLELGYTAPALRGLDRLRFRYRLDGFDSGWNDAGTQRMAQYTNLPPGSYKFIVEAGSDGKWGASGAMAITLRPQFYQTRWFFVLAIVSIVLAIVAVPLVRVRQLRARARELDARVQDAIRELKVLSGLLPICAWCKKVRDDGGYWSKIEAYLSARTDAQFTHGICPDCNDKMLADDGNSHASGANKGRAHSHHGHHSHGHHSHGHGEAKP
jgi:ligand-binding sensor domain-containing protein